MATLLRTTHCAIHRLFTQGNYDGPRVTTPALGLRLGVGRKTAGRLLRLNGLVALSKPIDRKVPLAVFGSVFLGVACCQAAGTTIPR
jgi:hypothetical protein